MVRQRKRKRSRPLAELLRAPPPALQFPIDAPVEVRGRSSARAGGDGSESFFREATVVGHHQPSALGYVVALNSRSRGGGGSPPRDAEILDASPGDVRPRPPPVPLPRELAPHDMVEALHHGGWRAGVVVRAAAVQTPAEERRRAYKVCFPASREVLEFEETALRPHRVFRDGRWVMAADEAESGTQLFKDGSQVEVSWRAETFGKCWSPAIILKVIGVTSFLVQYRAEREDGKQASEILDSQYIRPARNISHTKSRFRFTPSSHVEVFHEGSWWTGSIVEVNESTNKYVVKIKSEEADMDAVECGDLLTVDRTQLRPKLNWDCGKWVRSLKEKPANRGPQLTPCKRSISAALPSCSDSVELTASAPCNDTEAIRDEPVCHLKESHLTVPSQPSVEGFRNLNYDPKLCLSGHLELSSSQMITMPSVSVPQTRQLQAPLFGAFAQLRPLLQGPVSGMQSHAIDSGHIVGSEKEFIDPGKQTNDKGSYLMTGSERNINSGSSSGADVSWKRLKESVSPQAPELLRESPKIMYKRKRMADKKIEKASKLAANSEECSQGISVFLRESSVADEIIPSSRVPIQAGKFHQEDYVGAAQHGATIVSALIENSELSATSTLDNPGEEDVCPSNSSIQCGNKEANADESAIIMEQGTREEFCQQSSAMDDDANVHLLVSAESCEDIGDKGNMEAMAECVGSCIVPTEKPSSMGSVALNLLPSSENCVDNKKDGMGMTDHQENTCNMPESTSAITDGLPQQDSSAVMVKFAVEGIQSIENSEITLLSSIGVSNSTEAGQGDTLIDPKDSEHTPMSKYVPSRTQGPCLPLLQSSLDFHQNIMTDPPTESLAVKNLPFMKTSLTWEHLEEMEVFRNVPQQPDFHKFQQHIPELREGMALGLMISFANLAQSIRSMSIDDEDALFNDKMEGLSLLEADGFNVRHLRLRLETLRRIRNDHAELQGAIKDVTKKISHKKADCRHRDPQISVLNMIVRQLELQAYLFRSIMQSAISQNMNDASDIVRLKTEAGTLEQSYLSAEQSFSSAAAAPW
ncbi:unnamed protein product [Urochloa decumbens]|uniref:Agenet domain-containing protein n=1 Tax=Urochloa decumbens TaxID=240449 RepID=A0ABC9FMC6_9POAL